MAIPNNIDFDNLEQAFDAEPNGLIPAKATLGTELVVDAEPEWVQYPSTPPASTTKIIFYM